MQVPLEYRSTDVGMVAKTHTPHGNPGISWSVAGLFAGVGGFEEGFRRLGHQPVLFCEVDPAAQKVLLDQFGDVALHHDVRSLSALPPCDIVTAGFPCQDLSQAGQTKGIVGRDSSLVGEVFRLLRDADSRLKWLVLENVPFMLRLHGGRAIEYITSELVELGWRWAYRTMTAAPLGYRNGAAEFC